MPYESTTRRDHPAFRRLRMMSPQTRLRQLRRFISINKRPSDEDRQDYMNIISEVLRKLDERGVI